MSSLMIILSLVLQWGCAHLSDRPALAGMTAAAYIACAMPRAHCKVLRKKESLQDDRHDAWVLNYVLGERGN